MEKMMVKRDDDLAEVMVYKKDIIS